MKAKGSAIKRRVVGIVTAMLSTFLMSGTIPAWAMRADDDGVTRPIPAAGHVSADAVGGGSSWIIPLIVAVAIVAVSAALIGTVRFHRTRAVGAGA